MTESYPSPQETITPEQHSAFLAFGQHCERKLSEHRTAVQPVAAVSVTGNEGGRTGLVSPATGRRLTINDGQPYGQLYKVYAKPLSPGAEFPFEQYTLTHDHILRRRVFNSRSELDEDRRKLWQAARSHEQRPVEEEMGDEILSAEATYELIDELTRAQWDRRR